MPPIKTKRGKKVVTVDGEMFRFDRKCSSGGQFWRCIKERCTGRIKTDDNGVFVEYRNDNHCHAKEPERVTVRETVTRMNDRAETESTTLMEIYRAETANLSAQPSTAAAMPTFHEVCENLQSTISNPICLLLLLFNDFLL